MKRNINFSHLGNGISVYDTLHEKHGDYERVAHINPYRVVCYSAAVNDDDRRKIELYAATQDPAISTTQDQKVFITRPGTVYRIKKLEGGSDRFGKCEACHLNGGDFFLLVEFKQYKKPDGQDSLTRHGDVFGHYCCCHQRTLPKQAKATVCGGL